MSLADVIAAARAVRKRRPRTGGRPSYPLAIERAYEREVLRYTERCIATTRAALRRREDSYSGGTVARLRLALTDSAAMRAILRAVDRAASALRSWSAQDLARILRIEVSEASRGADALLDQWRRDNVALITSIPEQMLDQVYELVTEAQTTGRRVEDLASDIERRFDVARSRAELIARDQVGKANGDLVRARQEDAGVSRYVWSSSRDERTRRRHRELEGTVHAWDDPPVVDERTGRREHPGGDYQCRCVAVPVIDGLEDL